MSQVTVPGENCHVIGDFVKGGGLKSFYTKWTDRIQKNINNYVLPSTKDRATPGCMLQGDIAMKFIGNGPGSYLTTVVRSSRIY